MDGLVGWWMDWLMGSVDGLADGLVDEDEKHEPQRNEPSAVLSNCRSHSSSNEWDQVNTYKQSTSVHTVMLLEVRGKSTITQCLDGSMKERRGKQSDNGARHKQGCC